MPAFLFSGIRKAKYGKPIFIGDNQKSNFLSEAVFKQLY
jgi:hypothetical protein